jgi:hypothetical protein
MTYTLHTNKHTSLLPTSFSIKSFADILEEALLVAMFPIKMVVKIFLIGLIATAGFVRITMKAAAKSRQYRIDRVPWLLRARAVIVFLIT